MYAPHGDGQLRRAVDAHVALLARPGDAVVTSDPDDLHRLLDHLRVEARIIVI